VRISAYPYVHFSRGFTATIHTEERSLDGGKEKIMTFKGWPKHREDGAKPRGRGKTFPLEEMMVFGEWRSAKKPQIGFKNA